MERHYTRAEAGKLLGLNKDNYCHHASVGNITEDQDYFDKHDKRVVLKKLVHKWLEDEKNSYSVAKYIIDNGYRRDKFRKLFGKYCYINHRGLNRLPKSMG